MFCGVFLKLACSWCVPLEPHISCTPCVCFWIILVVILFFWHILTTILNENNYRRKVILVVIIVFWDMLGVMVGMMVSDGCIEFLWSMIGYGGWWWLSVLNTLFPYRLTENPCARSTRGNRTERSLPAKINPIILFSVGRLKTKRRGTSWWTPKTTREFLWTAAQEQCSIRFTLI